MEQEHACWWTPRAESELADDGTGVLGAGLTDSVLKRAAEVLGTPVTSHPSETEEYGDDIGLSASPAAQRLAVRWLGEES